MSMRGNGEGSVYREVVAGDADRPDRVRWIAQVWVGGRKHRRVAATEAQAKRKLREMLAATARGDALGHGNITVAQLVSVWRSTALPARDLAERTIHSYEWAIGVIVESLGRFRVDRLTPDDIEAAFTTLATEGRKGSAISRASLVKVRSVLSKVLDWGMRRNYVTRNVARVAELPAAARRSTESRSLTASEASRLASAAAGDRLGALWLTMLLLGLRPGEATGLTWSDIDLERGIVHVRRSLKIGRTATPVITEVLKTERSRRSLSAPAELAEALARHRNAQDLERRESGDTWTEHNLVFCTTVGTPINPSNLRRAFEKFTTSAGFAARSLHPHLLRHTTASLLSAAGVPLERVADVLGHDGTRRTARVYRHAVSPTVDDALAMTAIVGSAHIRAEAS
jgi:integrase